MPNNSYKFKKKTDEFGKIFEVSRNLIKNNF